MLYDDASRRDVLQHPNSGSLIRLYNEIRFYHSLCARRIKHKRAVAYFRFFVLPEHHLNFMLFPQPGHFSLIS